MPRWLFIQNTCIYILAWALRCSFLLARYPTTSDREAGNNAGLHAFFMSKIKINFKYEAHVNNLIFRRLRYYENLQIYSKTLFADFFVAKCFCATKSI